MAWVIRANEKPAPKLDSKEGIEFLCRWAKAHNVVLDPLHEEIAAKHGVSTDGVAIRRPIPRGAIRAVIYRKRRA